MQSKAKSEKSLFLEFLREKEQEDSAPDMGPGGDDSSMDPMGGDKASDLISALQEIIDKAQAAIDAYNGEGGEDAGADSDVGNADTGLNLMGGGSKKSPGDMFGSDL